MPLYWGNNPPLQGTVHHGIMVVEDKKLKDEIAIQTLSDEKLLEARERWLNRYMNELNTMNELQYYANVLGAIEREIYRRADAGASLSTSSLMYTKAELGIK